jgi:hypothetical protein
MKVGVKTNQGGTAGYTRPCTGTGIYIYEEVIYELSRDNTAAGELLGKTGMHNPAAL